jgi:photosystem II stability/assembly factor-like uncharacterized protein
MKKLLIPFLFFLLSYNQLSAQCDIFPYDTIIIYCGSSAQLDAHMLATDVSSPTTNNLNQVFFTNLHNGFIAGEQGTVLKTTDGGKSWSLTTFMPDANWKAIYFSSPLTGYIASASGTIAKTTDGGLNWNVIYSNVSNNFTKILFLNDNTGFAIGYDGLILKTSNGGINWTQIPSGTNTKLTDIDFVNNQKGYITGEYDFSNYQTTFLTSDNGGETWTSSISIPGLSDIYQMAFANENTGYVSGSSDLFKTTDGGTTWTKAFWYAMKGLALWDDTTGFVCNFGEVTRFMNSGASHETIINSPYGDFNDIFCPDNHTVIAIGTGGHIMVYREAISYHWEPAEGISATDIRNPVATPNKNTIYTVNMQLSNGDECQNSELIRIFAANYSPSLCMVTIDETNKHNKLIWNKADNELIDSVELFKVGNILGEIIKLGVFSASSPVEFVDQSSNPAVLADWYFLRGIDKCSLHTERGLSISPVHLSINQGIGSTFNLIWEPYNGGVVVLTYKIYRSTSDNPQQLIGSVNGSITNYTDLNAPSGIISYQIEAVLDINCNDLKTTTSSFSNIASNAPQGIESETANNNFKILSNPVTDHFDIDNQWIGKIASLSLFTLNGTIAAKWVNPASSSFDISALPSGIYLLKIELNQHESFYRYKLIKL